MCLVVPLSTPVLKVPQLLTPSSYPESLLPGFAAYAFDGSAGIETEPSGMAGSSATVRRVLISSALRRTLVPTLLLQRRPKWAQETASVPVPRATSPARPATTAGEAYEGPQKLCC